MSNKRKKRLFTHFMQLHREFLFRLDRCKEYPPEVEDIHQLRVSIKRIRAFLEFLQLLNQNFSSRKYYRRELRPLFKAAGAVRDTQIIRAALTPRLVPPNGEHRIFSILDLREEKGTGDLMKLLRKKKTVKRFINKGPKEIRKVINKASVKPEKALAEFSKQTVNQIIRTIKKATDRDAHRLHKIRGQIKRLFYNLQMAAEFFPKTGIDQNQLEIIGTLQNRLGTWHDILISGEFVKDIGATRAYPELYLALREEETFDRLLLYLELSEWTRAGREEAFHKKRI